MRARLGAAVLTAAVLLAGCVPAAEIEREIAEANRLGCAEAGFEAGTDAWRLCLLLQDSNRRLEAMERRMLWLESEVWSLDRYRYWQR